MIFMNVLDVIFGTAFLCFLFLGIVFAAYAVMFLLIKPKKKTERKGLFIIPATAECTDIEREIYFTKLKLAIVGDEQKMRIIILDLGLLPEQKEKCMLLCQTNEEVYLKNPCEILEVL